MSPAPQKGPEQLPQDSSTRGRCVFGSLPEVASLDKFHTTPADVESSLPSHIHSQGTALPSRPKRVHLAPLRACDPFPAPYGANYVSISPSYLSRAQGQFLPLGRVNPLPSLATSAESQATVEVSESPLPKPHRLKATNIPLLPVPWAGLNWDCWCLLSLVLAGHARAGALGWLASAGDGVSAATRSQASEPQVSACPCGGFTICSLTRWRTPLRNAFPSLQAVPATS